MKEVNWRSALPLSTKWTSWARISRCTLESKWPSSQLFIHPFQQINFYLRSVQNIVYDTQNLSQNIWNSSQLRSPLRRSNQQKMPHQNFMLIFAHIHDPANFRNILEPNINNFWWNRSKTGQIIVWNLSNNQSQHSTRIALASDLQSNSEVGSTSDQLDPTK